MSTNEMELAQLRALERHGIENEESYLEADAETEEAQPKSIFDAAGTGRAHPNAQ